MSFKVGDRVRIKSETTATYHAGQWGVILLMELNRVADIQFDDGKIEGPFVFHELDPDISILGELGD